MYAYGGQKAVDVIDVGGCEDDVGKAENKVPEVEVEDEVPDVEVEDEVPNVKVEDEVPEDDVHKVEVDIGAASSLKGSGVSTEDAVTPSFVPAVRRQIHYGFPRNKKNTGLRPFYPNRCVLQDTSTTKPLTSLHEAIVDYIYSSDQLKSKALGEEEVFLSKCVLGTRRDFLNLKPPNHLNDNLIDCWSCYLNFQERNKTFEAPNRYFSGSLA